MTYAEQKQLNINTPKMSVKEQMELLQQVKSLLAGVLTQEEFEMKKQEILNS